MTLLPSLQLLLLLLLVRCLPLVSATCCQADGISDSTSLMTCGGIGDDVATCNATAVCKWTGATACDVPTGAPAETTTLPSGWCTGSDCACCRSEAATDENAAVTCARAGAVVWPPAAGSCAMDATCRWISFDAAYCVQATRCADISGRYRSITTATGEFWEDCDTTQEDCLASITCSRDRSIVYQATVTHDRIQFTQFPHSGTIDASTREIVMTHGYTLQYRGALSAGAPAVVATHFLPVLAAVSTLLSLLLPA